MEKRRPGLTGIDAIGLARNEEARYDNITLP
jgi:hypothetical protein